jgi:benzoyl-CoA 2,3-dioxygenase component A
MTAVKQHLIDPEICIRCYTCEEQCPLDAISHDDNNVVVDASLCNFCMECIAPCPTGSIDNWRLVEKPWSLTEQFSWDELPPQAELSEAEESSLEALDDEVARLIAEAHQGTGGVPVAPHSASRPTVNLFTREHPAIATVQGNYRITEEGASRDVRHIVLHFGRTVMPVLEGQTVGIIPPGTDAGGKPHHMRLYSVASPRDGERPNTNNLALTVKHEEKGVCSTYLANLKRGDEVKVTGPYGSTFLMPQDPAATIIMVCTGTGSAPFRAFTERRRRAMPDAPAPLIMFFGARTPGELPYFGPLQKVPTNILAQHLVYSRLAGRPREYVQDRMRAEAAMLGEPLKRDNTHVFICGLKGMEAGVDEAFADICRKGGLDWSAIKPVMRASGRYHVETY